MQNFLDASDNYYKEKCFSKVNRCNNMANLIGLQIQLLLDNTDTRVINLEPSEVVQLMTFRGNFHDSKTIADAYNKTDPEDWVGPLYHQVIVLSNFQYLEEYLKTVPLTEQFFLELLVKFKEDPHRVSRVPSFKLMISHYLSDQFLKYDIAKELNFEDVVNALQSTNSETGWLIQYFKKSKQTILAGKN